MLAFLDIYGYYDVHIHMYKLLNNIDKLQCETNALRPIAPTLQRTLQEKLRIEWTYNSNAIEGNSLTYGETAFFLREGLTSEGKPLKDYLEAKNHAEAIEGLYDILERRRDLTEGLIKELHAVLLKGVEFTEAVGGGGQKVKKPVSPGQYKTHPNHVLTLSGKIHFYTDPLHVNDDMEKLIAWFHEAKDMHPVEKAVHFHYRFVAIHPFDDGNGRLARILMNLSLMQEGYPPCIIQMRHRRKYLECLEIADTKGDLAPFIVFVGNELLSTQKTILEVLHESATGRTASINPSEREMQIVSALGKGPLSIGHLLELLPQIKRPTLKSDLQRLVRSKKIKKKGRGKGVVYVLFPGRL